jgi:hypothetical protein
MGTASLRLDTVSLAWRGLWNKLASPHGFRGCVHSQGLWRRLRIEVPGVLLEGSRYCIEVCLELALSDALRRAGARSHRTAAHRVPLGLLLLSRQQVTVEQLRAALAAQRNAGRGRIGEWLQALGFASEQQITAALARQWSCPVLRTNSRLPASARAPHIPIALLETFVMLPVEYVEIRETLHIAFGEGIDYKVLYAIEQMTGCHTEPCMAVPSFVRTHLQRLSGHRAEDEVVFDCVTDTAEICRIIRSYCARLMATEIRLAACGPYLWARLLRPSPTPLDLLFVAP